MLERGNRRTERSVGELELALRRSPRGCEARNLGREPGVLEEAPDDLRLRDGCDAPHPTAPAGLGAHEGPAVRERQETGKGSRAHSGRTARANSPLVGASPPQDPARAAPLDWESARRD
jgi:hypothetical protein